MGGAMTLLSPPLATPLRLLLFYCRHFYLKSRKLSYYYLDTVLLLMIMELLQYNKFNISKCIKKITLKYDNNTSVIELGLRQKGMLIFCIIYRLIFYYETYYITINNAFKAYCCLERCRYKNTTYSTYFMWRLCMYLPRPNMATVCRL